MEDSVKNFVLFGAAGYIAPRHFKAIKETGNNLLAIVDPHDSVGIIDSYFPEAKYFREFEIFQRHIYRLLNSGIKIDYVTVCSPNYLHDAHIRFGLMIGANVICEKPLTVNPWNCDVLSQMESEYGSTVFPVLQLRYHPDIVKLKQSIKNEKHDIVLKYITSRGDWYNRSWKGDINKSGGLATNIGVHFFDMLIWVFGAVEESIVREKTDNYMSGDLILKNATVNWELSTDEKRLPKSLDQKQKTFRHIEIDDNCLEFSGGFTDLHTVLYKSVLGGNGFRIADAKPALELVNSIKNSDTNI